MFVSARSAVFVILSIFSAFSFATYIASARSNAPSPYSAIASHAPASTWTGSLKCYTGPGKPTGPVHRTTTTKTTTLTVSVTTTSTRTTTITPPPTTSTALTTLVVSATTVLPPSTKVTTSTATTVTVITATAPTVTVGTTTTEATTTVTVHSTSTSIFPTPSNFQPAGNTLPGAVVDNTPQKRIVPERRSLIREARALGQKDSRSPHANVAQPSCAVSCTREVDVYVTKTVTVTAPSVSTTVAPRSTAVTTKTVLTTTTFTSVPPAITSTSVTTSTSISTANTTPTSTSTSTYTPTTTLITIQTSYPACAPNNLIGNINGQGIDSVATQADIDNFVYPGSTSAYDCCVACMNDPSCALFFFYAGFAAGQLCTLATPQVGETCSAFGQYTDNSANYEQNGSGFSPDQGFIVGNAYCGEYTMVFTPAG